MAKLYLIGTHHLDLKGPERLEKFLGFVRPDTIGLESTVENFERRIKDHAQIKSQSLLLRLMLKSQYDAQSAENVTKYLKMLGYELWVPERFAKSNNGTNLICCDQYKPEDIRAVTREVFGDRVSESGEVTTSFIDEIAKTDFVEYQKQTDASYKSNPVAELKMDTATFKAMFIDRDEVAESKIRQAFSGANHTMVYIGGNMHFFGNYPNLHERLKDLNPIRMQLPEVDQF